ncbi:MAG: hypothetical protein P1P84_02765 [Deferrisomatales bacterium]|nr:hypothetical protein [Deferrisomatales bacterium]
MPAWVGWVGGGAIGLVIGVLFMAVGVSGMRREEDTARKTLEDWQDTQRRWMRAQLNCLERNCKLFERMAKAMEAHGAKGGDE